MKKETPQIDQMLRPAEAAAYCGVTKQALYKWAREGKIAAPIKLSSHTTVWRKSALDAFISEREVGAIRAPLPAGKEEMTLAQFVIAAAYGGGIPIETALKHMERFLTEASNSGFKNGRKVEAEIAEILRK